MLKNAALVVRIGADTADMFAFKPHVHFGILTLFWYVDPLEIQPLQVHSQFALLISSAKAVDPVEAPRGDGRGGLKAVQREVLRGEVHLDWKIREERATESFGALQI